MSRIIGGAAGGRRLVMPAGRDTRPTADRTREGLFSTLGGDLRGQSFLDLYAGSGAVGLEAASRGAAPVVLVERRPSALAAIRRNLDALDLGDVRLIGNDVGRLLTTAEPASVGVDGFDIAFLDPPYDDDVTGVVVALLHSGWVRPGGRIVVERATKSDFAWPAGVGVDRSRRYGDSTLWYGRRP